MQRRFCWKKVAAALLAVGLVAAAGAQVSVSSAHDDALGDYLVGPEGHSLYIYLPDEAAEPTCTGGCSAGWPPLELDGELSVDESLDLTEFGHVERADGVNQVTFAGWPLYSYRRDRAPGDVAGQGVSDEWFLISPAGVPLAPGTDEESGDEEAADPEVEAMMQEGGGIYARFCASCHGQSGAEALASHVEILAGNRRAVSDADSVIHQIIHGGVYMPAFGDALSDTQVAAVTTFVRNSWGNSYGPVSEEEVSEQR